MRRRAFLTCCAAAGIAAVESRLWARTQPLAALESRDLDLDGDANLARRARALWPRNTLPGEKLPVLILLHGLGETSSERLGLSAWTERYGLASAYERLLHPPVTRSIPGTAHWSRQRLERVNTELHAEPMGKVLLVCPVTPNVYKLKPTRDALDRYAEWIGATLLPAVRAQLPAQADPSLTAIDGCSLGGYIALEVFIRKSALFGSVGVIQAAIGPAQADEYAERLKAIGSNGRDKPIHLLTSAWDPYRRAHERLSTRLAAVAVKHDLEVLPGGHDQIFLREIGTLSMLLWHDRVWKGQGARGKG